jgi:hypothetical protein
MQGVSESYEPFSRKEADVVAEDVQGEKSTTPASGEGRRRLLSVEECGDDDDTGTDGCGCKRCERVDMQRVPPQESPARISDDGGI